MKNESLVPGINEQQPITDPLNNFNIESFLINSELYPNLPKISHKKDGKNRPKCDDMPINFRFSDYNNS